MNEDLITQYGILRPLNPEDYAELRLSLAAFEESSGLELAPYILDARFLDHLHDKFEGFDTRDDGSESDWQELWALVHERETIIGFMDFTSRPDDTGTTRLRWTVNPDWLATPFVHEALRELVRHAFRSPDCRSVRTERSFRSAPEMDRHFRKLGFREESGGDPVEYRLSKAVEGRLL